MQPQSSWSCHPLNRPRFKTSWWTFTRTPTRGPIIATTTTESIPPKYHRVPLQHRTSRLRSSERNPMEQNSTLWWVQMAVLKCLLPLPHSQLSIRPAMRSWTPLQLGWISIKILTRKASLPFKSYIVSKWWWKNLGHLGDRETRRSPLQTQSIASQWIVKVSQDSMFPCTITNR